MPSKFKIRKAKEIVKAVEELGYKFISQKGSHMKFEYNGKHIIIPNHGEISIGTLNGIYKDTVNHTNNTSEVNKLFLN